MKTIEIKSLTDYLRHVQEFEQQHIAQWIFRGVRNTDYELVPSLFRIEVKNTLTNWDDLEEYMLQIFQRESTPYLDREPKDELELLTLAQHHGLPTRLLDWSINPLIALFFSVESYDQETDSAVWCYGFPSTHNCFPESTRIDRRLTVEKGSPIIFPNHISQRITNQSGCFTTHELPKGREPFIPLEKQTDLFGLLEKIEISKKYKKNILDQLYDLGYHHGLIYPGLDGLSRRIRYEASTTHKRCTNSDQFDKYTKKFE
ncbi:FRG domain-containing protein [Reichenbachiella sp. MALMAid0571]|uniref:FRG domain-containing protein n=1 Tax=Reichenbachiella sp. MALMAid0571 TaxID=3143939 RepID=UPI0032DF10EE